MLFVVFLVMLRALSCEQKVLARRSKLIANS